MAVKIRCSECRKKISVDEAFAGSMCRCPYCKSIVMVPKIAETAAPKPTGARPSSPGQGRVRRPQAPQSREDATGGSGLENVTGSRPIIDIANTEQRRTRRRGVTPIARPGTPQLPPDIAKAAADARSEAARAAEEAKAAEAQAAQEAQARQKAQSQAEAARKEAERKAAEARARAKALEEAKRQASAEARQAADAKARQAADAERRARAEAEARRNAEEAARKAAEEAEKRIRDIEKQAAKLVADAQKRAAQQVEEATKAANERQQKLQAELEALKAANAGKSAEEAEAAGRAAAEAEAKQAQQRVQAEAQAAAADATKMIEQQLEKLRATARQAKEQAAQAQAAREAAEAQADQARQQAAQAAAEAGHGPDDSAQAAKAAMDAARQAAREAEEATKAAAKHAANEQAARQKAEAGAKRAAQAEATAKEYESSAQASTGPAGEEDEENIPEAPAVDVSQLTPEQLAAIPQANPVFFQGMVSLVLIIVLIFMTVGCIYLGVKLMEQENGETEIYVTSNGPVAQPQDEIVNPFIASSAGPRVAGNIAIEAPVLYVIDAGGKMGEFFPDYPAGIIRASAQSLPGDAQAGVILAMESGAETLGDAAYRNASALVGNIEGDLGNKAARGASSPSDAVRTALKHSPKTVVLLLRGKDLQGEAHVLAESVKTAGAKFVIVLMGYDFTAQKEAVETARDAGATVVVYETRDLIKFHDER